MPETHTEVPVRRLRPGMVMDFGPDGGRFEVVRVESADDPGRVRVVYRREPTPGETPGEEDTWFPEANAVRVLLPEDARPNDRGFDLREAGAMAEGSDLGVLHDYMLDYAESRGVADAEGLVNEHLRVLTGDRGADLYELRRFKRDVEQQAPTPGEGPAAQPPRKGRKRVPRQVVDHYEREFQRQLEETLKRAQNPQVRAVLKDMLDRPAPIWNNRTGGYSGFVSTIINHLYRYNLDERYELSDALAYVIDDMLGRRVRKRRGGPGSPQAEERPGLFSGFNTESTYQPGTNPLQARFLLFLRYAVLRLLRGETPVAPLTERPRGRAPRTISNVPEFETTRGEVAAEGLTGGPTAGPAGEAEAGDFISRLTELLREEAEDVPAALRFVELSQSGYSPEEIDEELGEAAEGARDAAERALRRVAERSRDPELVNTVNRARLRAAEQPAPAEVSAGRADRPLKHPVSREDLYASIAAAVEKAGGEVAWNTLQDVRRNWMRTPPGEFGKGYRHLLEAVVDLMVRDRVLQAVRRPGGGVAYRPGPHFDRYRGAGGLPHRGGRKPGEPRNTREKDYATIAGFMAWGSGPTTWDRLRQRFAYWSKRPPRDPDSGYPNRLEEAVDSMVKDGVLKVSRLPGGGRAYSPGPHFDRYHSAGAQPPGHGVEWAIQTLSRHYETAVSIDQLVVDIVTEAAENLPEGQSEDDLYRLLEAADGQDFTSFLNLALPLAGRLKGRLPVLVRRLQGQLAGGGEEVRTAARAYRAEKKRFHSWLGVRKPAGVADQDFVFAHLPELKVLGDSLHVADVHDRNIRLHLYQLARLPWRLLDGVKRGGAQFYLAASPVPGLDELQEFSGQRPRGWDYGTWDDVSGAYHYETRAVALGWGIQGRGSTVSIAVHECGHAIGHLFGYDDDPALTEHHKRLFHDLDEYLQQEGGPGNRAGRQELFAEGLAALIILGEERAVERFDQEFVTWLRDAVIGPPQGPDDEGTLATGEET